MKTSVSILVGLLLVASCISCHSSKENTVGFPDPGKNYQESSTQVKEFILNIIPPVLEVPGGSQSE